MARRLDTMSFVVTVPQRDGQVTASTQPSRKRVTERQSSPGNGRSGRITARSVFDMINGKAAFDEVGVEPAAVDTVRTEAVRAAGDMSGDGDQSWTGRAWRMTVTDAADTIVFSVPVSGHAGEPAIAGSCKG